MAETTELTYHGRPLTAEPINTTLLGVEATLSRDRVAWVTLEPGDATRYAFVLVPVNDNYPGANGITHLVVTRLAGDAGGGFRSGAVLPNVDDCDEFVYAQEIERLAGTNEWSAALFTWWFGKLWERINA